MGIMDIRYICIKLYRYQLTGSYTYNAVLVHCIHYKYTTQVGLLAAVGQQINRSLSRLTIH